MTNTEAAFFLRQLAGWAYFGFIGLLIWKLIKLIREARREYYGK